MIDKNVSVAAPIGLKQFSPANGLRCKPTGCCPFDVKWIFFGAVNRPMNRCPLRCERSCTTPNPNDLANCALLIQRAFPVWPRNHGSAKFNEPRRTSLAPQIRRLAPVLADQRDCERRAA